MKNLNPILNFRLDQENGALINISSQYSIKTGIHSSPKGTKLTEQLRFAQMTMITETREASDSSENT